MVPIRKTILLPLFFALFAALSGCEAIPQSDTQTLQASGVVESVEVVVSSELGGRVAEVWVEAGDQVQPEEPLFRLSDRLLETQLRQAEAALAVAQANYDLVASGLTPEQQRTAVAAAELELVSAQNALNALYDQDFDLLAAQVLKEKDDAESALDDLLNHELQRAVGLKALADAEKAVENAEKRLNIVQNRADQADIDAAKAQVVLAEDALEEAREDFEPYRNKPEDNLERALFQASLSASQQAYDAAVRRLNALRSEGTEADIAVARADLAVAQAQLLDAQRDWEEIEEGPDPVGVALLEARIANLQEEWEDLLAGPDPDDIALGEARLANAQAQLALAQAGRPTSEELSVAKAQLDTARANLEAIQVQLEVLVVEAPMGGVVMTRSVEPGEVLQPGASAVTLGQLDQLTVKVYVPEDRYGQINLGDTARVTVDSFPDETFEATVARIADRAEFTPRNVQTEEDRRTTVFAVELSVTAPGGKLKPGMPADVDFDLP